MIASPRMLTRRPSLAAAGATACAALALWVSFGALTFVGPDNGGPYVGILPSPMWLAVLLLAAALITIVGRPSARSVAPLWLSAVAILPWLPLRLPLSVFIWTGNSLVWLWTAIAAAMLCTRTWGLPLGGLARLRTWDPASAGLARTKSVMKSALLA